MELDHHVKGAESQLSATAGVCGGSQQGPAMPDSFQGDWASGCREHSWQLQRSQFPKAGSTVFAFLQTGPADSSLPLFRGWQAPGTWDSPRKVLGVEGGMNQRQPAASTSLEGATGAKPLLIGAGQLRAPELGLEIFCHHCLVWILTGNGTQLSHQLQILPPA